jgi:hypothetical protein
MSTVFDPYRQAPTGQAPEATEGDAADIAKLCTGAQENFINEVDRIRQDPMLSDEGKADKITKLTGERQAQYLDRAQTLDARNQVAVAVLRNEERKSAGLVQPDAAHASAVRAQEIRALYANLSPSEKLAAVHSDDVEVLKALYFQVGIGPALLDAKSKSLIEEKLLSAHDPARHAVINVRIEDARRAAYSLEVTKKFINRNRTPDIRSRIRVVGNENK